jgi:RNA polymerase sigma factor (sigma-70 family)
VEPNDLNARLASISTQWTKLFRAHQGQGDAATAAQRELLLRYYGAVYRYLLALLRDPVAAEDLTQEFAVRFLRGDFKSADPQRGRFRDFIKGAVRHLAHEHWRKAERAPAPLPLDSSDAAGMAPANIDVLDQQFLESWREDLLAHTWDALAEVERHSGVPCYTVLRSKAEAPQVRSAQLAARLSGEREKPFTEQGIRQILHRARKKFAELLVEEVARSLETSEPEKLEQELIELDLLGYCQSALADRVSSPGEGS